ncbi:MAG: hypothetical protein ACPL1G_09750 [Thermodesulfovibrionales bacterium]
MPTRVYRISPNEARRLLEKNRDILLLDVRQPEDRPGFWEIRGYSNSADPGRTRGIDRVFTISSKISSIMEL